tara:strand:+ start:55 stop:474 length:420 start_codon:yes stop_codon:yes gene_type:complete
MAFTKQQTIIGVIVLALVGIYLYKNKKTEEELSGGKDESSSGGGGGGGVGASNLSVPEVVVAPPIVVPVGRVVRGRTMPVLNFNPSITPTITPTTTQVIQNAQATQGRGTNTVGGSRASAIIPANGGDYYSATKDGYYF